MKLTMAVLSLPFPAALLGSLLLAEPGASQAATMAEAGGADPGIVATPAADPTVPDLAPLLGGAGSRMAAVVDRFSEDRAALFRRHGVPWSGDRRDRLRTFLEGWREGLRALDYEDLDAESRIDWVLLDNQLRYRIHELDRERLLAEEMATLIPFADVIIELQESRRRLEPVEPRAAAEELTSLAARVVDTRSALERALSDGAEGESSPVVGLRAADAVAALRRTLADWYDYHAGYDPLFTWWTEVPYGEVSDALEAYGRFLRERVVGYQEGEDPPIVGDPIGSEGLDADLRHEMIPYSPAELIAIAEREYAWCVEQLKAASRELGYDDDWLAALEHVKNLHVEPGAQPALILDLYEQSVAFLKERDLVTIPPLAEEVWRMEMMSPERQKVSPFFLGGETIIVSYPTDAMAHDDKLMSMRGNNEHFSRATVHHELIPGHHLQGFMNDRYNPDRQIFRTPFWHEGNALYWEFRLWDLGFPRGPEDRMGMLFWRTHRAARIIFSLSFHLGRMTPDEAVDFLVERVGHERANAEAEVRRSFNGSYPPLYQAGYMLGGLQFQALHEELVQSGRMTEREFHDAILRGGPMPVEMVRARLLGERVEAEYSAHWRFADR